MFIDWIRDIWDEYRNQVIIGGLIVGILGCLFVPNFVHPNNNDDQQDSSLAAVSLTSDQPSEPENSAVQTANNVQTTNCVYVDVKGAVVHPAAYQLQAEQRVGDAIQKAGGYADNADSDQVNLAQKVTDQMIIYVPQKGEKMPILNNQNQVNDGSQPTPTLNSAQATPTATNQEGKVNINTATLEQLKGLTGVGDKKAQKIIDYRQQHGGFKSIDELKNVNGFGEKSFESLSDQICV